jgi:acetyl-CoA carboxylase carboxyltransferase component
MAGADRTRLARELREAFALRARLYDLIDQELTAELGPERAAAVLGRAIERRGHEAGQAMFSGVDTGDPRAVADAFLASSPDGGTIYPADVSESAGALTIAVQACPLKDTWCAAGVAPERIARLCRIAGRFDHGLFGETDLDFSAETWTQGREGCCRLHLARRFG